MAVAAGIEGACRHLIGDRLDITGARWGFQGAGAILTLRAVIANGDSTTTGATTWLANTSGSTQARPKASTYSLLDPLTPNELHPIRLRPARGFVSITTMPVFRAADGTELAYHVHGTGDPLICVPGGPMRAAEYLGDLGGLSRRRQLILLDLRGTGESAVPADPASYRCDGLTDDVLALQDHLGLARADLLAHSAGANIAVQYAVRHRERVGRLALITPGGRVVGIEPDAAMRREVVRLRQDEPWFAAAAAAYERVAAGGGSERDWAAMAPFFYGRWDAAAHAHDAAGDEQTNEDAAGVFAADGAFDPVATRAALSTFGSPVLVLAGSLDLQRPPAVAADFAALFPAARLVIQPGAGHYPWLDDPDWFVSALTAFLDANEGALPH